MSQSNGTFAFLAQSDAFRVVSSFCDAPVLWALHGVNKSLRARVGAVLAEWCVPFVYCRVSDSTQFGLVRVLPPPDSDPQPRGGCGDALKAFFSRTDDPPSSCRRPHRVEVLETQLRVMPVHVRVGKAIMRELTVADATAVAASVEGAMQTHLSSQPPVVPFIAVISDSTEVAQAIALRARCNVLCRRLGANPALPSLESADRDGNVCEGLDVAYFDLVNIMDDDRWTQHADLPFEQRQQLASEHAMTPSQLKSVLECRVMQYLFAPESRRTRNDREASFAGSQLLSARSCVMSMAEAVTLVGRPLFRDFYAAGAQSTLVDASDGLPISFRQFWATYTPRARVEQEELPPGLVECGTTTRPPSFSLPERRAIVATAWSSAHDPDGTWTQPILCRRTVSSRTLGSHTGYSDVVSLLPQKGKTLLNVGIDRLGRTIRVPAEDYFVSAYALGNEAIPLYAYVADNDVLDGYMGDELIAPSDVVKFAPWENGGPRHGSNGSDESSIEGSGPPTAPSPSTHRDPAVTRPWLLVGPPDTFSSEHAEPHGTGVWVHVHCGRKRWWYLPPRGCSPLEWRTFVQTAGETVLFPPVVRHVVVNERFGGHLAVATAQNFWV